MTPILWIGLIGLVAFGLLCLLSMIHTILDILKNKHSKMIFTFLACMGMGVTFFAIGGQDGRAGSVSGFWPALFGIILVFAGIIYAGIYLKEHP